MKFGFFFIVLMIFFYLFLSHNDKFINSLNPSPTDNTYQLLEKKHYINEKIYFFEWFSKVYLFSKNNITEVGKIPEEEKKKFIIELTNLSTNKTIKNLYEEILFRVYKIFDKYEILESLFNKIQNGEIGEKFYPDLGFKIPFQDNNLLIIKKMLIDFEYYCLSQSQPEEFPPLYSFNKENNCRDIKLSNNKNFVDNEIDDGLSCNDYQRFNLCKNKKITDNYIDFNLNRDDLTAKNACCVCGGGISPTESYVPTESYIEEDMKIFNFFKNQFNNNSIVQYKSKGISDIFTPRIFIA